MLDGTKTWISNGGIADFYVVFAKADEGISAFVVDAKEVDASERIDIVAPHPMATVKLTRREGGRCSARPGQGFKLAMRNLDIFRTTVAAAALGFARRALDEALGACARAQDVRPDARRLPADAGQARRHGDRDRRRRAAHLSRGLDAGREEAARHARGGDGEDVRHRGGAAA